MLNIKNSRGTVFQVEVKEKQVQCNLSTGKKNQDDTYTNMTWRARFVGNAFEKAKELQDKDRIEIINGAVENTYDKENEKLYVNVVIFDFNKI